ncbi:MAG TPA: hypothetical protein VFZ58_03460 [Candidatus Saccharimonadales bacterium]
MSQRKSLRYLLNAYSVADCCRLASIIQHLVDESGESIISRDAVAKEWVKRYPRHAGYTRPKNVRGRITRGLTYLKAAGIVVAEKPNLKVLNAEYLRLSAVNLEIVEKDGEAIPPVTWPRQPAAPPQFQALKAELEMGRLAAAAALEDQ